MKSAIVGLLCALAAIGCSTTPITEETGKPVPAARVYLPELAASSSARTARVTFLRDAGMAGSACVVAVRIDGRVAFDMQSGEYHPLYLEPGRHSFELGFAASPLCPASDTTSVNVLLEDLADERYRVQLQTGEQGPRVAVEGRYTRDSERPDFEWDRKSTAGVAITLDEDRRLPSSDDTVVLYAIRGTGFSADESAVLWSMRGAEFVRMPASIDANGAVRVLGQESLGVADYVAGQPLELVLASGGQRAFARTVPFPIEAKSGTYSATVELFHEEGLFFLVIFGGFEPGETVEVLFEREGERRASTQVATSLGFVATPLAFHPGDRGNAVASATASHGAISIRFKVGKDALAKP